MKSARSAPHIFVAAFSRETDSKLDLVFEPRELRNEVVAVRFAEMIEDQHAGVIAWSRSPKGVRVSLYSHGDVPETE